MASGEVKGDVCAVAVTDHHRPFDFERLEQLEEIRRHVVRAVARGRRSAVAVPAQVVREDPEALGERGHYAQMPHGEVAGDAVDHDQIRSLANLLVVDPDAAAQSYLRHASLCPTLIPRSRGRAG